MKKHIIFFITLLSLLSFQATAQAKFPSSHGYWEGNWGGDTPFNVYLEPGKDGTMTGTITWSLTYYDVVENKSIETQPKEFLKGTWNEKTGLLMLNTIGEEDPHGLVVPGFYQMQMDMSGAIMKGFTTATNRSGYQTAIEMSRIRA